MSVVSSPKSVTDAVAAFEAQPLSSFGDASLQSLANQVYNLGLADGQSGAVPSSQVVADLQALDASEHAGIQSLISKYSPAPPAPAGQ